MREDLEAAIVEEELSAARTLPKAKLIYVKFDEEVDRGGVANALMRLYPRTAIRVDDATGESHRGGSCPTTRRGSK